MHYGICILNSIALRPLPSDKSELISQVLFGESFEILEDSTSWFKIKLAFDAYEGWIDKKQQIQISSAEYHNLQNQNPTYIADLVNVASFNKTELLTLSLGAELPLFKNDITHLKNFETHFEGATISGQSAKNKLIDSAYMYLNAPYLWGGKTPFGIDCSGFTQMVYKLNGYKLLRDASQQAMQGEALSFIEESEPGDLAFFDNEEGKIVHVGMILSNNQIIHAHGKVRIDLLDHSGIYNVDTKRHSHKLRVIKKII